MTTTIGINRAPEYREGSRQSHILHLHPSFHAAPEKPPFGLWNIEFYFQRLGLGKFDEVATPVHPGSIHDGSVFLIAFRKIDNRAIRRRINSCGRHLLLKIFEPFLFQIKGLLLGGNG